ncbi:MAG: type I glyceraldehyde-3-phosphate dehydrogenase [Bacillota bacterium]|nr:type I glyceraldehyde-3-phosphate dehydrogenase [Eubacteriales bacterium]MDD4285624.1 type I glyceraldehyde-3-phosphate dehydrogenase [Eubacteriales bacterium]MDI9491959.1 type I glyceraldehyde-3-phosphate dehydrogenase [Bacillota bacterium]NLV69480.1 type I glyceraldehyde-3-phosphate dehydrogenase [Clostridiales bacterium]HPF18168.1 type I glyceraldehyde-3-phosphate dehydrogenase [Bacillota bacterium]
MAIKLGINGFGRIGRVTFRAAMEQPDRFELKGINVRNADLDYMIYMIRYDTIYGRFCGKLERYTKGIIVDGVKIPVYGESEAEHIPWSECGAEYIVEATGAYVKMEKAIQHLRAGAKKVVMSAPAKDIVTPTFVYGVNHEHYASSMDIVSNASCTTNCLAPLCKVLQDHYGIQMGLMSTIHAATAKQKVVDARSLKDWRTGRSVFGNVIPSSTGAAKAVGLVIPELQGKMTGISYRVPTADVSVIDLNVCLDKPANYASICAKIKEASETTMKDVLDYVDDEVVSTDFIGDPHPAIFDAREGIALNDKFFKLIAFYDNEWGYASNLLRMIGYMDRVDSKKQ